MPERDGGRPASSAAGGSRTGWDAFVDDFLTATFAAHPDLATWAGRHELDGRLPDWSSVGLASDAARLRGTATRARAFDGERLGTAGRFERDYLLARIDHDLFWLESARSPSTNPTWYANALDPNVYVTRPYAPLAERLRAYTAYARAVPEATRQIRANLAEPLPHTFIEVARTAFGGMAAYYEDDVPGVFGAVPDARLQAEFREANAGAAAAMRELDAWFANGERSATDHFALGPELFAGMLRDTERVDVPLEELERVGREELRRNLAALAQACAALDPASSMEACVARVQARKPLDGPVVEARRQLDLLERFVREQELVTIPGDERALVAESPPYMRWNAAYIDIPGPYERGLPAVYYIAPPDPAWSPAEREAYLPGWADLLFVSLHEVWPGHFLQFLHSNRSRSRLGGVFVGYAFAEGWAHYAEEMMWEAGFNAGDPETRIGQL
ncbi:MAG: DUF885 family protein, partial [Gemmatimonadetes bacterium]|nr:DUF885 family protein [Gemmatimonadota bacterium]